MNTCVEPIFEFLYKTEMSISFCPLRLREEIEMKKGIRNTAVLLTAS